MTLQSVVAAEGSKAAAARKLGLPYSTFKDRLRKELSGYRGRTKRASVVSAEECDLLCDVIKNVHTKHQVYAQYTTPARCTSVHKLMAEVAITDLHLGKFAWDDECGENFDAEIADRTYENAIIDTIDRLQPYVNDVELITLVIGSDFFQTGFDGRTTVSGTVVDSVDTRFSRTFEIGYNAIVRAIGRLSQIAPVHGIYIPGNHDEHVSWALAFALAKFYSQTKHVSIDYSPKIRKYLNYGANMLCVTHGDDIKVKDLPMIMAAEQPKLWGASKFRECHIGHFHRKKNIELLALDETFGINLRVLSALSGQDAWHVKHGFVGSRRAAETFLHSRTDGLIATFNVNARDS